MIVGESHTDESPTDRTNNNEKKKRHLKSLKRYTPFLKNIFFLRKTRSMVDSSPEVIESTDFS